MELSFAQVFEGLTIFFGIIIMCMVSIAILRRYQETKYLPALLAASGFLILGFIFTPGVLFGVVSIQLRPDVAMTAWSKTLAIINTNAFVTGLFVFAVFTRQVFRPKRKGSLFFLIFIGILLFGSKDLILMFEAKSGIMQWNARFEIRLLYAVGNSLNFGWLAYESLSRWRLYRGQLKEGKELDPLVINRFLLWGLAGLCYTISSLVTIFNVPYEMVQPFLPTIIKSVLILTFAILSYLSWSPPEWFKQIIIKGKPAHD
ncbi:MAG: hypothetical protein JSU92_06095 [Deltaproteobacteria bacterium]|nr:MAG: hypothetical protein JSU92_06095 [Deltaproteobacteria bacterium]